MVSAKRFDFTQPLSPNTHGHDPRYTDETSIDGAIEQYEGPYEVVERDYGHRGVSHPSASAAHVTEVKFEDLTKKTKEIRKVQKKIQRELSIDFMDPMLRACYGLWDRVKRLTGRQKKTLQDLFNAQTSNLNETASLLYGLAESSNNNNSSLFAYMDSLDDRLYKINSDIPSMGVRTHRQANRYQSAHGRVWSLDKTIPERSLMRKQLRRERIRFSDMNNDLSRYVDRRDRFEDMVNKTENVSIILIYGRDFAYQLGDAYFDVGECIEAVSPSIVLAHGLYSNERTFYDLIQHLGENIRQAYTIESNFENRGLVKTAYRSIPALPPGKNTAQVIDFVNDSLNNSAQPLRQLFKER